MKRAVVDRPSAEGDPRTLVDQGMYRLLVPVGSLRDSPGVHQNRHGNALLRIGSEFRHETFDRAGMGDDLAHSSIRFGIGRFNTQEEVDYVAGRVIEVVKKLRELSPLYEMAKEGIDLTKVQWTAH